MNFLFLTSNFSLRENQSFSRPEKSNPQDFSGFKSAAAGGIKPRFENKGLISDFSRF